MEYENIDEYIALFPTDIQHILQSVRKIIHEEAPEAIEAISYQMPTFKLGGNLVHFGCFKDHISIFPTGQDLGVLEEDLKAFRTGRGTISFPLDIPIPYDLIRKIIRVRYQQQKLKKLG